jgi:hypothetical protein
MMLFGALAAAHNNPTRTGCAVILLGISLDMVSFHTGGLPVCAVSLLRPDRQVLTPGDKFLAFDDTVDLCPPAQAPRSSSSNAWTQRKSAPMFLDAPWSVYGTGITGFGTA